MRSNEVGTADKRVRRTLRQARTDRSGAVSVIFALLILPLMIAVGAAVDYAIAARTREMLQAAADAAAVGAISMSSSAVKQVIASGTSGEIKVAESDALKIAQTNFSGSRFSDITSSQISVQYTGNTFSSDVALTSEVPTYFVRIFGVDTVTVSVRATAQNKPIYYYNFYVLIDNSPSMGLGATAADISALEAVNGGCAFACHITGASYDTYALAQKQGITLRYKVVSRAVQSMITNAAASQLVSNQYKMAVYSLGADAQTTKLTQVAGLSSSLASVASAAANVDLMTIPYQNYNNDQQTDLLAALNGIRSIMGVSGSGLSANDPIKVLFLISDGVEDAERPKNCWEKLNGNRCQQPLDTTPCVSIKANDVKLASLYTTYQKIPSNTWYTTWIAPFQTRIATKMKACASDGLYAEVPPSGDVSAVLTQLFANVVSETHLTH
ncbi:pilus assembly protein TadG-related protein [Pleomorphomonas sp. NRK KF1]|uniref:pilus assembly protein TadG-related protein n=1 Tax=Pleomorphomonas sp. NRK KF1 TaxID=2943000 RepID=UPI0020433C49|nr:pilus assembly protein TadG-related protein [Pleomorphomonas sp. NRK KF1]MCM5552029.1 pilus assembly protein TadG-related protein [Pleomorphomonas sp. NRK KF1]